MNLRATYRRIGDNFGVGSCPLKATIRKTVVNLKLANLFKILKFKIRERPAPFFENIQAVWESVKFKMSIKRHMGIGRTSTWRILKKDLVLHHYKIQISQELKSHEL